MEQHPSGPPGPPSRPSCDRLFVLVAAVVMVGAVLATLATVPLTLSSDVVDLNGATAERLAMELELDPALADRLVAERELEGGFRSVEEAAAAPVAPRGRGGEAVRRAVRRLDVNQSDAETVAVSLGIARPLADRIVAARRNMPGGRFGSPEQALTVPVLSTDTVARHRDRLVVRTPGSALARQSFWVLCAGLLLLASARWAAHQTAAGGDKWIVPVAWLVAGLALCVWLGMGDRLRDRVVLAHHVEGLAAGVAAMVACSCITFRGGRRRADGRAAFLLRHAPAVLLGVWAVLCFATRGGASVGVPGLALLGPFLTGAVAIRLFRFHGVLVAGALPIAAVPYGTRPPGPRRSETLGRILLPIGSALVVALATRSPGLSLVAALGAAVLSLVAAQRRPLTLLGLAGALAVTVLLSPLMHGGASAYPEWVHPSRRDARSHGHLQEALWGAASGGIWGTGLGLGQTESIPRPGGALFAAVAEDLGAAGCVAILVAYVALIWRFCRVSVCARDDDGRLLGAGLAVLLASQALLATGGALGLTPLLDVPLPFASDSRVLQCAWFGALGLVMALSKNGGRTALGTDRRSFRGGVRGLAAGATVAVLGAVGLRVVWVQMVHADRIAGAPVLLASGSATKVAENPRLVSMALRVERGSIYDSHERVLATSDLREMSASLPGDGDRARRHFRAGRYYPHGAAAAPVVGLWRRDSGAVGGIEKQFDRHLRGYAGLAELVDSYRDKDLPTWGRPARVRGGDVVLTIDAAMQDAAFGVLTSYCRANGTDRRGALVALHALQGHPVAAASLPSADPNLAVLAQSGSVADEGLPVGATDRATTPVPTPSPLFKIAVALAIPPYHLGARFVCDHAVGPLSWAGGQPPDAPATILDDPQDQAHRALGLERAVGVSCNSYFAQLAVRVGAQRLHAGISGIVGAAGAPTRAEFARRLPFIAAIGESTFMSPMDIAAVVTTATSASSPVVPRYCYQLRFRDGRRPKCADSAVSGRSSVPGLSASGRLVRSALTEAVREGPLAEVFAPLNREVAGRTASVARPGGGQVRDAWFAGFVPADSPAYVVTCLIEGGGSGFRSAAPAARDLMHALLGP